MRLFLAIPAPEAIRTLAVRAVAELRGAGEVRWVQPDLLHLTLKFLGEVPEERRQEIEAAAAETANKFSALVVECGGVGAFPNLRKPRTVWLGLSGQGEAVLAALAQDLETSLAARGFPREERPFRGHLTLGRVNGPKGLADLGRGLERLAAAEQDRVEWPVGSFQLVKSDLRPAGPIYTPLAEFPLVLEE